MNAYYVTLKLWFLHFTIKNIRKEALMLEGQFPNIDVKVKN